MRAARREPVTQPVLSLRYGRTVLRLAALTLRHPLLGGALLHAAWRFRARRWWASPPFLPLPPRNYLAWRMETAFGSADALPDAAALERYLRWTRAAVRSNREAP